MFGKMKIGILTFHNALNYGAVLQAYATQVFFTQLGHDVTILNYKNRYIENVYKKRLAFSFNIKELVVSVLVFVFNNLKKHGYSNFIEKYLQLSEPIDGDENPVSGYDLILVGSDQVWNPKQTDGFDKMYWGDFKHDGVLASWAASFRENAFEKNDGAKITEYLKNFDSISVREHHLKTMLSKFTDKNISVLQDPTLMLWKDDWAKVCSSRPSQNYVLVYAMVDEALVVEKAKLLAMDRGLDLIILNPYTNAKVSSNYKQYASPQEFVSYMKNADVIVTSSFHGTAFSIIFEKEFYCVIRKLKTNVRIEALLATLGLQNRIIDEETIHFDNSDVDYVKVNAIRRQEIEKSKNFIGEVLTRAHSVFHS